MAKSERSNLRIEQTAEGVVVHLVGCGSLNEQTTPPVEVQLLALAAEHDAAHLLVDLSNVHYMSSIGLGMLIGLRQKMRSGGGRLTLRGVTDEIYEMFDATKLTRLLDVERDNPPSS